MFVRFQVTTWQTSLSNKTLSPLCHFFFAPALPASTGETGTKQAWQRGDNVLMQNMTCSSHRGFLAIELTSRRTSLCTYLLYLSPHCIHSLFILHRTPGPVCPATSNTIYSSSHNHTSGSCHCLIELII